MLNPHGRSWLSFPVACALAPILALVPLGAATATEEADRITEALGLCAGMSAADVGAGDGEYSSVLAHKVGASGRVYATEVERDKVEEVRARAEKEGLRNVTAVLGDQKDTGLPPGCCDAVLLRLVYHHFTDPPAMRRSLWRALRPGGRLVVIEVPPQASWRHLEGVPERGGHGIESEALVAEMREQGFAVVQRYDTWPGEEQGYGIVFQRPSAEAPDR